MGKKYYSVFIKQDPSITGGILGHNLWFSSDSVFTKEDIFMAIKNASKDFFTTREGLQYLSKKRLNNIEYVNFDDFDYNYSWNMLSMEKYGLIKVCENRDNYDGVFEFDNSEPIITLDELGFKLLNVSVEYKAVSNSAVLVPKDLPLVESVEYAKQNIDLIPSRPGCVSYTKNINTDSCSFEEKTEDEDLERDL